MISIDPRFVGAAVGLTMGYAFYWDYIKYKRIHKKIDKLERIVEKYHMGETNGSTKEKVEAE